MFKIIKIGWVCFLILLLSKISVAAEIIVFADVSLTEIMTEVAVSFEAETSHKVVLNFSDSTDLKNRIIKKEDCDIFFPDNISDMDGLVLEKKIKEEGVSYFLENSLVVIAHKDSLIQINRMLDLFDVSFDKLAIADPNKVHAGKYAVDAIVGAESFQLTKKIFPVKNVRNVLDVVGGLQAELGIIYRTDARLFEDIKVVHEIDSMYYPSIVYPVGVLSSTKHEKEVNAFLDFLKSPEVIQLFQSYEFKTL